MEHNDTVIGMWSHRAPEEIDEIIIQAALVHGKHEGYMTEDEALAHYIEASVGNYRVINNSHTQRGGSFILFSSHLAPREAIPLIDNVRAMKSQMNPVSRDVKRLGDLFVQFTCPNCSLPVAISVSAIDEISGATAQCTICGNISYLPARYREAPVPDDMPVTGGVIVDIGSFGEWYLNHPVVLKSMNSDDYDYGVYMQFCLHAFCRACFHRFNSTALMMLPMIQFADSIIVNTHNPGSKEDLDALNRGQCPACQSEQMLVVIVDYPLDAYRELVARKTTPISEHHTVYESPREDDIVSEFDQLMDHFKRMVKDSDKCTRLLNYYKQKNPGRSELWILEKAIYDIERRE